MDSEGKPQKTTILAIFMAWYFFRNQLMVINIEQQRHCASFLQSNNSLQKQPKFKADDSIIVQKNGGVSSLPSLRLGGKSFGAHSNQNRVINILIEKWYFPVSVPGWVLMPILPRLWWLLQLKSKFSPRAWPRGLRVTKGVRKSKKQWNLKRLLLFCVPGLQDSNTEGEEWRKG